VTFMPRGCGASKSVQILVRSWRGSSGKSVNVSSLDSGLVVDRKSGTNFHCLKSSWTLKYKVMSATVSVLCVVMS
jgi:hypothetical protein